ncbi:MAG: hypothetical protein DRN61_01235 [Thaumarchaeota archaeon]|nr:MAG: hypothetical protein DRN61_01235 [Nitrososphaerota archaeon]
MFVGVFNEGIYRTNLEGKGWENIRFGPGPALSVYCLAIDPNNPKIIYPERIRGFSKATMRGTWKLELPERKLYRVDLLGKLFIMWGGMKLPSGR